jgi:aspartate kinase
MALIVQKYGGTSLADQASRESLCGKVLAAKARGDEVALVVSAMGRLGDPYSTDTLLELLSEIPGGGDPLVCDLMASCGEVISGCVIATLLKSKGVQALPMTAYTAGISAEGPFGDAMTATLDPSKIRSVLSAGVVPVVTGYQGVDLEGRIHTFGRGGSDTTAVAVGAALKADFVDIYKDVPGVAKADPRVVPDAPFMSFLDYESMFRLARHGARVLHDKSATLAKEFGVKVRVRSTFDDGEGTLIGALDGGESVPSFVGMATGPGPDSSLCVTAVFSPSSAEAGVAKAMSVAAISGFPFKAVDAGDRDAVSFVCDAAHGKNFARKLFAELMAE